MCNTNRKIISLPSGEVFPDPTPTVNYSPSIGVLVNGDFSVTEKADIAVSLGCDHARAAIKITGWTGSSNAVDAYESAGLDTVININRGNSPYPFATSGQLAAYSASISDILNTYTPKVAICENEEFNSAYHTGPISDYVAMLQTFAGICSGLSIPSANGGMSGPGIKILTYRWIQLNLGQYEADQFGVNCMTGRAIKSAKDSVNFPNYNDHVADVLLVLDCIRDYCDYCNLHIYEDQSETHNGTQQAALVTVTPNVVRYFRDYIYSYTGKKCITNETGQRNNDQPALVTAMMQEYITMEYDYITWFSGDGAGGSNGLNDATGALYPNGTAFKNFADTIPAP